MMRPSQSCRERVVQAHFGPNGLRGFGRKAPAINLRKSGTRNEELLIDRDLIDQHHRLFRALNSRSPLDAMQALQRHMQQAPTNEDLLNDLIPSR